MSNFHPLEVVDRGSETQQVDEIFNGRTRKEADPTKKQHFDWVNVSLLVRVNAYDPCPAL